MNLIVPHGFEANYVVGFARGLAANGVTLRVISSEEIEARLAAAAIPQCNLRGSQDEARPAWQKAINLARYYVLLLWTIFRHRGETIHFIGLLNSRIILIDGVFLPIWLRLWAARYLHTAHNALPHGRENSLLFRRIYRWVYRFPHHIVVHTTKVARQLEMEFNVDKTRISVISIGLNEEIPETSLSRSDVRHQLGLPVNAPVALFFGKVEPYKGVDLLAEAWGAVRTPEARLIIVGLCPDPVYARKIRFAIAHSARAGTIEWREGFVPNEVVAMWLKACDVVVMPYRNIYQSGVVFLCLRFGVPIVATNVGSLAEYIDKDSGIIAGQNDPAGFAAALDRFFSAPARFRRDEIARRAAKYGWTQQCRAIKTLYH